MEWRDQGILLSCREHGESAAIIEVFTREHGRHAGVVRGGGSRKTKPILQPGATLMVNWRARLEEHLGVFSVEPQRSRAGLLNDRSALSALNAITAISLLFLPEREPHPGHYQATEDLLDQMEGGQSWPAFYILWEIRLLEALGYRLSLSDCAVSGVRKDLVFVSPRSGHAVTREAGAEWANRLLRLPPFLRPENSEESITLEHLQQGFALTGHFLRTWLCPAIGQSSLPAARERLEHTLLR